MIIDTSAVAAFLSFLAAAAAAAAAFRMPYSAAKFAEQLRRDGDVASEKYRHKVHVFATLLQERAAVYSQNGVGALNMVAFVFNDCVAVREAWAELFQAFSLKSIPEHVLEERLRKLLVTMAEDLKLSDRLRTDDIARVYHPTAIAQDHIIKDLQRRNLLNALQRESSPASNVQADNLFPPKPE